MTPAIFGIAGPRLSAEERAFFRDCDPVGYILFARNCIDRDQMRALTDELKAIHGREKTFISIDQEGGRVARMKPPEWNRYPAGQAFDELYQIAPASAIEAVRLNAEAIARELSEVGVTVDFHAPFDVRRPETSDVIGDRALGTDPLQVAALGRATLEGMARGGVLGCLKHMPGHGRATVDSHKEMPVVPAVWVEFFLRLPEDQDEVLADKLRVGLGLAIPTEVVEICFGLQLEKSIKDPEELPVPILGLAFEFELGLRAPKKNVDEGS